MQTYRNDTESCYQTEITSALDLATANRGVDNKYFGLADTAKDGTKCQAWDDPKLLAMYPKELAGGHNYCRAIKSAGLVSHPTMTAQEIKGIIFQGLRKSKTEILKLRLKSFSNPFFHGPRQPTLVLHGLRTTSLLSYRLLNLCYLYGTEPYNNYHISPRSHTDNFNRLCRLLLRSS